MLMATLATALPRVPAFTVGEWDVALEPVTPSARPLIEAAMAKLSPETSRRRFFTVRYRLSDDELDRLTHLDGWTAYAIAAVAHHPDGRSEGAGIARFARLAARPTVAEAAVLVVDAWQGRGLGKRLLAAIGQAALARGIDTLRGIVLNDNDPMLGLLSRHAPGLTRIDAGDHYDIEVRLDRRRLPAPTV
jgi:GNAT superfamily N-acetyltransferase